MPHRHDLAPLISVPPRSSVRSPARCRRGRSASGVSPTARQITDVNLPTSIPIRRSAKPRSRSEAGREPLLSAPIATDGTFAGGDGQRTTRFTGSFDRTGLNAGGTISYAAPSTPVFQTVASNFRFTLTSPPRSHAARRQRRDRVRDTGARHTRPTRSICAFSADGRTITHFNSTGQPALPQPLRKARAFPDLQHRSITQRSFLDRDLLPRPPKRAHHADLSGRFVGIHRTLTGFPARARHAPLRQPVRLGSHPIRGETMTLVVVLLVALMLPSVAGAEVIGFDDIPQGNAVTTQYQARGDVWAGSGSATALPCRGLQRQWREFAPADRDLTEPWRGSRCARRVLCVWSVQQSAADSRGKSWGDHFVITSADTSLEVLDLTAYDSIGNVVGTASTTTSGPGGEHAIEPDCADGEHIGV